MGECEALVRNRPLEMGFVLKSLVVAHSHSLNSKVKNWEDHRVDLHLTPSCGYPRAEMRQYWQGIEIFTTSLGKWVSSLQRNVLERLSH